MTTVTVSVGQEGPRHDPYGYEEVTVRNERGVFTSHRGLARWIEVRLAAQRMTPVRFDDTRFSSKELDAIFEVGAGVPPDIAIKIPEKLRQRRLRVHRSHGGLRCMSGMPGESLLICACGDVVDMDFNEGEIL